ncbi:MAG TPA: hypothetical protein VKY42_02235 [Trueperaceae bacterium]|nr:hypothetical protein [Trueperaceae bacterium]
MKRLACLTLGLVALALSACAPQATVRSDVMPTLISVTVPDSPGGTVVLQGRYFGDGFAGQADNSFVLVGANMNGEGGVQADVTMWSPTRIEFTAPERAGSGFVFVVVGGVRSNGLPASLP